MSFIGGTFYLFFICFFVLYYIIPAKYRYVLIFAGSYVFYGWANPAIIIVLAVPTIITYCGGRVLEKKKTKGMFLAFFLTNIFVLVAFKYTNTLLSVLTDFYRNRFFVELPVKNIVMPVGLSFYVFQSSTYLSDVYRKGNQAERNVIRYAAFVVFFPTVLSGPIQKSRDLLPQLREPKDFDFDTAKKGIILLVWGTFEKICVSNRLLQVVNAVYDNYEQYFYDPCGTVYFIIAAVSFSLYIYADFSAYSDMARGISKMLMIDTAVNFKNPYLSTSLTEFWTRWHATLNDWFVENVYIPLGGSRKGSVRKYLNVMAVFIISGAWHGSQKHFIAWGAINGLLVVAGRLLAPLKRNIYIYI